MQSLACILKVISPTVKYTQVKCRPIMRFHESLTVMGKYKYHGTSLSFSSIVRCGRYVRSVNILFDAKCLVPSKSLPTEKSLPFAKSLPSARSLPTTNVSIY